MPSSLPAVILAIVASSLVAFFGCSDRADERRATDPTDRTDPRPNVVLITVDTLRPDYLGAYGFDHATSPRIDELAAKSVVFERALAAASVTAPAHASILTSRFTRQHTIGANNTNTQLSDERSVAEVFRDAGYATAAFVSNYVLRADSGLSRGFETYDDDVRREEANRRGYYERIARDTNARALGWLKRAGDAPFFLWVHYQDPHGPYSAPGAYRGRFSLPGEPGEAPLAVNPTISGYRGVPNYQALEDASLASEYRSRYADEIFYADEAIGDLLDAVESHRNGREQLVLLSADHGESLGEGEHYFEHGFGTTPQLAHVPMILRAPGLAPGRRSDPVHHVDIAPTLLELAGLELPQDLSGIALGPYLREERPLEDRILYCDIGRELSAYHGDGFVRLSGVSKAWKQDLDPETLQPVWIAFDWHEDGSWSPMDGTAVDAIDAKGRAEITRYFRAAKPLSWTDLSPHDMEQLRALGYLEPAPPADGAPSAPSAPSAPNN